MSEGSDQQFQFVNWPTVGFQVIHGHSGALIPCSGWIWVNYNDLTTTSLEIMVSKGNHPQMGLIQVSEILQFTQMDDG